MGVGADLYMYDIVVKSSRSLSPLLMSSCFLCRGLVVHIHDKFSTETRQMACLRCDACISGGATWQDLQSFLILE